MSNVTVSAEHLYKTFQRYPLKPKISGCPHCELDAAETSLHLKPLRQLTWNDFGVYPFKAMTTFGDCDDFKHFLPRMLELYVIDSNGARYEVRILFGKLQYANCASWPPEEVTAVRAFVRTWLDLLHGQADAAERSTGSETTDLDELEDALSEYHFDVGEN